MAMEGYLSLGGTEISNAQRFQAYTQVLGILSGFQGCPCPNLDMLLNDSPYIDPKTDLAPWYDPNVPESEEFAGVWIQSWTGFSGSTISREFSRSIVAGATPGPIFDGERTVAVTAFLAAASETALSYGLAWLASALRAGADCDECVGDEACFLDGCPEECGTQTDMDELWSKHSRHVFDVALVDGPRLLEKQTTRRGGGSCCQEGVGCSACGGKRKLLAKVEWTMTAGIPWIYSDPVPLVLDAEFVPPSSGEGEEDVCTVNWIVVEPGETCSASNSCPTVGGCLSDPACQNTDPPIAPVVDSPCSCTARLTEATIEINSPAGLLPRHLDSVPIIEVTTGDADMRRLTVRFFPDPLGFGCGDPLDSCRACSEISLTFAPRDSTIVIDGRLQRAYVTCPGGGQDDAAAFLFGPNGEPVEWPAFSCGSGLCVQVLVDDEYYSPLARVNVSLAARMDAA